MATVREKAGLEVRPIQGLRIGDFFVDEGITTHYYEAVSTYLPTLDGEEDGSIRVTPYRVEDGQQEPEEVFTGSPHHPVVFLGNPSEVARKVLVEGFSIPV